MKLKPEDTREAPRITFSSRGASRSYRFLPRSLPLFFLSFFFLFFFSPLTNSILDKNNFNTDCRWQFLFVKNRICKHSFSTKLDFLCARTNVLVGEKRERERKKKGRRKKERNDERARAREREREREREGRKREQPMGCSRGFQSGGITSIYSGPITSYWISKDWNCYLTFLKTHITIFSRIPDAPSCYFCSVAVQRIICYVMLLPANCATRCIVFKRFTNAKTMDKNF